MSEPPKRRLDWVVGLLILSVATNCLVGGFLLGRGISTGAPAQPPPAPAVVAPAWNLNERVKLLPPDEQKIFQQAMRTFRLGIDRARLDLDESKEHFPEAMLANPYDPDRMAKTFADLRAKTDAFQTRIQDGWSQSLAALTPASRKQLGTP
jgi:hypothetical protein